MEEKSPQLEVIIKIEDNEVTIKDVKKLVEELVSMQKGCSCHCTISVKLPWLRFE